MITLSTSGNVGKTLCDLCCIQMFIMFCLLCDTVYAQMTVIRPADMDALQNALDSNNVSVIITISFIPILMNLSLQTYLMVMFRYLFSSPRLLRIHFSDALMSSLSQICAIARELCFALTVLLPPL
jgi:hypothetical protein